MAAPVLSVLDPSPIFDGCTALDALEDSRALAMACDDLGYTSYWVQEHHNTPCFASVAPAVLMADLAARTREITLGAGGVMLPNYSPLKIAEQFLTLSALHPGRIDLGLGRATGADPRTSAALLGPGADAFPNMLRLLMDWLLDASGEAAITEGHRAHGISARPSTERPGLWMLVSSPQSAAFAGAMGLHMAYADFLSPGGAHEAIAAYRDAFTPSAFADAPYAAIAMVALACESDAEAAAEAAPAAAWNVLRGMGRFAPFPGRDMAAGILSRVDEAAARQARARATIGTGDDVALALKTAAAQAEADELYILTIAEQIEVRIRSYQLIIEAMGSV